VVKAWAGRLEPEAPVPEVVVSFELEDVVVPEPELEEAVPPELLVCFHSHPIVPIIIPIKGKNISQKNELFLFFFIRPSPEYFIIYLQ
jgi:hypothetical protein